MGSPYKFCDSYIKLMKNKPDFFSPNLIYFQVFIFSPKKPWKMHIKDIPHVVEFLFNSYKHFNSSTDFIHQMKVLFR